jgi:predicted metal-dependent peptidase
LEYPFFGQLAIYLKLVERDNIQTAGTDGIRYYYNREFVNTLSDQEVNFLTAHEVLHAALGHIWRRGTKDKMLFNCAADYVINSMIKECDPSESTFKFIKGGLYDKKYDGLSTEEVYELLIQEIEREGYGPVNGSGNGKLIDDHDIWSENNSNEDSSEDEKNGGGPDKSSYEDWQGRVVQAAEIAQSRQKGKMPSLIQRMIKNLTQPQKNWKQLLAEFVEYEVNDYCFSPPDRRFMHSDILLPDFSEQEDVVKNIVFAVDTSGSIQEKEFLVFLSEIVGCMNQFGGKVRGKLVYCDYEIPEGGIYELEDAIKSLPRGGGGTDFRPVFEWIEKELNNDCVGLVYLTDGYGSYPNKPSHYPVLWVLINEYNVPFGMTTQITV